MFEIEKDVPMPSAKPGREPKYPLREMLVGDSFFVPDGDQTVLSSRVSDAGRRLGKKFATRKVDGGVRIWRIE